MSNRITLIQVASLLCLAIIGYARGETTCPEFDAAKLVDTEGISDTVKNWLQTDEASGAVSFVEDLAVTYFNDKLTVETGKAIRDEEGDFSEVCQRLPLKDDECYFAASPESSFLDTLVAKYIPFGDQIIAAKNEFENLLETVSDTAEEVHDFFLPSAAEDGTCIVVNDEMIGISDHPGFPPPAAYEFCNCMSMKTTGVPACTVQPYFRGFAMSLPDSDALSLDLGERLGLDQDLDEQLGSTTAFYDGFVTQEFVPSGDIWAGLDFEIGLPKLAGGKANPVNSLVCVPSEGQEKNTPDPISKISLQTSLLIKNNLDQTEDDELLALAVIEDMTLDVKNFFEIDLGSAYAALRVQSANPDCQPSGIFGKVNLRTNFGLGDGLKTFLSDFLPDPSLTADFGVTWLDQGNVDPDDFLQSFFLKVDIRDFKWLGVRVERAQIEFQYLDENEFQRRRDYDLEKCCALPGVSDCSVVESPLVEFVNDPSVTAQPTVAMFLKVDDLTTAYGLVKFHEVELQFLFQIPENADDFATKFLIAADIEALYIARLRAGVSFEVLNGGDDWMAEFSVSSSVKVGLGTVTTTLEGSASVGEFTNRNSPSPSRQLADSSFQDADWDLTFSSDWDTAEWLVNIGEEIYEGLVTVYNDLAGAWGSVEAFAQKVFDEVVELGKAIGGAFETLLEVIGDATEVLGEGLDALTSFLSGGGPVGELGAEVFGAVGGAVLDTVKVAVEIGDAVLDGDWDKVGKHFEDLGEDIANAFGFGKSIRGKTLRNLGRNDQVWECPLQRYTWRECNKVFGVRTNCRNKASKPFPEERCVLHKSKEAVRLRDMANTAQAQEHCRMQSAARNQGLAWVGESATVTDFNPHMAPTKKFNIGRVSALNGNATCKMLPFEVSVNKLAEDSKGTSGQAMSRSMSSECIDFGDETLLGDSLVNFRSQVAREASEASRGRQGLDQDSELSSCLQVAGGKCDLPTLTKGDDFKLEATVTCDIDFSTFKFESVFGHVDLKVDPRCSNPSRPHFEIQGTYNPEDGCASSMMTIHRYAMDCCGQMTEVIEHKLYIETLPPRFIPEPGSMDTTEKCDSDISPLSLGYPERVPGCRDAMQEVSIDDSAPEFNRETCTTTIERTFVVTNDGCEAKQESFVQTITLVNDYAPEWDFFPQDITVGVFGPYGTEVAGFPTVFQRCGASPVQVTYTDVVTPGKCFAEREIERVFRAVDLCGHESVRVQRITIANSADALPLGDKSLSWVYAGYDAKAYDPPLAEPDFNRRRLRGNSSENSANRPRNNVRRAKGSDDDRCVFSADVCGVTGAPTDYECKSSLEDEFSDYEAFLAGLTTLDMGHVEQVCGCPKGDPACDQTMTDPDAIYGVQIVTSAGECVNGRRQIPDINSGSAETVVVECPTSSSSKKGSKKGSNQCTNKILTGQNPVYNIFSVQVEELETSTIHINAPAGSIALINVIGEPETKVYFDKNMRGVFLDGIVANDVLWNFPFGADLKLNGKGRSVPFAFRGTVLNRRGEVYLSPGDDVTHEWQGQVFVRKFKAKDIAFQCGHFTGFASCAASSEVAPPTAVTAETGRVKEVLKLRGQS